MAAKAMSYQSFSEKKLNTEESIATNPEHSTEIGGNGDHSNRRQTRAQIR